jgi:Bacterial SH3 domain
MKKFFFTIALLGLVMIHFSQTTLIIQGDVCNVRNAPNTTAEIVGKVKRFDNLKILETAAEMEVNGNLDNWYKVALPNGKSGFVFGHFTSLKRQGQITKVMELQDIMWGDCFHLILDDIDFGSAMNQLDGVPNLEEDADRDDKIFVGRKFKVTYNELFSIQHEFCNPDLKEFIVPTPTIISIELLP